MSFVVRPTFTWCLRSKSLSLGHRTLIMGILNVTPDSFSDGGSFDTLASALRHALEMIDAGADLIDIGGESTRPTSSPLTPAEEQARVLPVIRDILKARPNAILSIDTYHADTARLAIEAGAEIVNDVSGLLWDTQMAATCAKFRCGVVLMHTRGRPHEWRTQTPLAPDQILPLVLGGLKNISEHALATGIARKAIVLDPGFGFGKRLEENYPLLAGLDELHSLGFPILAGVSRKSFLSRPISSSFTTAKPDLTLRTTAANVVAILAGAHILRVHDVAPSVEAATIADRILAAHRSGSIPTASSPPPLQQEKV